MRERPYGQRGDQSWHAGYAQSGRRRSEDRPDWWSDDDLPHPDRAAHYDADYDRRSEGRGDYRDYGGSDGRRSWAERAADDVKALFGSERAERRRELDRRLSHHDHGHDYRGVGPRTRHDEDDELRDAICDMLSDEPDLDASDILVRVIDNEAILDGTVRSRRQAKRAYEIAGELPGIVHVRERLGVRGEGRHSGRRYEERGSRRWS